MHRLLHIYGPFSIYSYGLAIAVGLSIFTLCIKKNKKFDLLNLEPIFAPGIFFSIIGALIGGRLVFMISHPLMIGSLYDFFAVWQGGYSVLGNIIGVLVTLPLYLWYKRRPILETLDIAAIYIPLLQAIARFGCLAAGCCHGLPSHAPWAIVYTDPEAIAPCFIPLHPTQLYSSVLLFIAFIILYQYLEAALTTPGQLTCAYLILASIERFVVDFWRGDQAFFCAVRLLSIHQIISLVIGICAALALVALSSRRVNGYEPV